MNDFSDFLIMPRESMDAAIQRLDAAGTLGLATLLRAARRGRVAIMMPVREMAIPRSAWSVTTPAIMLIADDPPIVNDGSGQQSAGPAGWAATPFVLAWARAAVVRGDPDNIEPYRVAIRTAAAMQRVALIETDGLCGLAWAAAFEAGEVPCVTVMPGHGDRLSEAML